MGSLVYDSAMRRLDKGAVVMVGVAFLGAFFMRAATSPWDSLVWALLIVASLCILYGIFAPESARPEVFFDLVGDVPHVGVPVGFSAARNVRVAPVRLGDGFKYSFERVPEVRPGAKEPLRGHLGPSRGGGRLPDLELVNWFTALKNRALKQKRSFSRRLKISYRNELGAKFASKYNARFHEDGTVELSRVLLW